MNVIHIFNIVSHYYYALLLVFNQRQHDIVVISGVNENYENMKQSKRAQDKKRLEVQHDHNH